MELHREMGTFFFLFTEDLLRMVALNELSWDLLVVSLALC